MVDLRPGTRDLTPDTTAVKTTNGLSCSPTISREKPGRNYQISAGGRKGRGISQLSQLESERGNKDLSAPLVFLIFAGVEITAQLVVLGAV